MSSPTPPTAAVADAALRLGIEPRLAPVALRPLAACAPLSGRARPVTHLGSVDVLLETIDEAAPGDVMVIDNGGRLDEACIGDLMVLEAERAGLAAMVVWGLHRDTAQLREIGLPVFSLGALPTGPLRLDPQPADALSKATIGEWTVTRDDVVLADEDGAVFVPADRLEELFGLAESIRDTEHRQADEIRAGRSLREQVSFAQYLERRAADPSLTFRQHLRAVRGAIEE